MNLAPVIQYRPFSPMKTLLAPIASASMMVFTATAATVDWGTATSNVLGDKNGNLAANTGTVRLGYFSGLTDVQIASAAAEGNKISLSGSFQTFDSVSIGTGYGGLAAAWTKSSVNLTTSFAGKQIYYFALNAGTVAAATQWGIFTKSADAAWTFPSDSPSPGSAVNDLSQVPQNPTGILAGSFGPQTDGGGYFTGGAGATLYKMSEISAVPEPATFATGAMLALVAAGARRRRRG